MSEENCPEKDHGETCETCGDPDYPCRVNSMMIDWDNFWDGKT
jgi:hypothetical protein